MSSAFGNFNSGHTIFELGKTIQELEFLPISALQKLFAIFKQIL